MHPQHNVPGSASYLNSPQVPTNNHLSPSLGSATILGDQQTSHQFQANQTKGKVCSIKAGNKRVGQPPEIFVFDFTNGGGDGDRTNPSKQACMTNGNVNDIDIPVALGKLTQKSPLHPSIMASQGGSISPSFNSPHMIQPQQPEQNIEHINNGNQSGGQLISLPNNKNSSPNCQPSQTMLWC